MKLEKMIYEKERVHKILFYGLISVVVLLITMAYVTNNIETKKLSKEMITNNNENKISMYVSDENGDTTGKDGTKYKQTNEMPEQSLYDRAFGQNVIWLNQSSLCV